MAANDIADERLMEHLTRGREAWGDRPDEHTTAIDAAHPLVTKNHGRYARALAMVENRHSKSALVDLVNWLLARGEESSVRTEFEGYVLENARRYGRAAIDMENDRGFAQEVTHTRRVLCQRAVDLAKAEEQDDGQCAVGEVGDGAIGGR